MEHAPRRSFALGWLTLVLSTLLAQHVRADAAGRELDLTQIAGGVTLLESLVSILILPLTIPVLIFGVSASYAAVEGPQPFLPPFLILIAITLFFAVLGPATAAAGQRAGTLHGRHYAH